MKSDIDFPPPGTVVSVLIELEKPASVCIHDLAHRPMCTIIPLAEKPDPDADGPWILSCWGNGPGIVCFLDEWDGKPFFDVEIIKTTPRSVIARSLEPQCELEHQAEAQGQATSERTCCGHECSGKGVRATQR